MSLHGGGEEGEVHVYAKRGAEVTIHHEKGGGGGAQLHGSKHRSKVRTTHLVAPLSQPKL